MRRIAALCLLLLLVAVDLEAQPTPRTRGPVARFMRASGYPKGRPGYVVDHIIPLCAGGPNTPANMQWQPAKESYAKDRYERALCAALKRLNLTLTPRKDASK